MIARMRTSLLLTAMLLLSSTACGDDGGASDTGGSTTTDGSTSTGPGSTSTDPDATGTTAGSASGSATGDTTTEPPADTTAASGETTAATEDGTASTTDPSTTDGTTEGGMGTLDAEMSDLQIFQDCMPIVPFDPVNASFTLALTNTGDGPATATVSSATFLSAGGAPVATIGVSPGAFGPIDAGDSTSTVAAKTPDSLMPAGGCATLQCGQRYTLELVLDVDGAEVIASDTATVGCVF